MVITYHGEGYFRVQAGETVLVVDPLDNRMKADVTLKTSLDLKKMGFPAPANEISGAGEYEINGVEIQGLIASSKNSLINNIYVVVMDEMRLAFFGNPEKIADEAMLNKLGEVDIAFLPPQLAKVTKTLEPKIVVPAFFKQAKAAAESFGGKSEIQEKLVIKKKDLPSSMKIIVLKS